MMHDLNNKIKEQKDLIVQLIEKDEMMMHDFNEMLLLLVNKMHLNIIVINDLLMIFLMI